MSDLHKNSIRTIATPDMLMPMSIQGSLFFALKLTGLLKKKQCAFIGHSNKD
jgi:hypothetical protein